jgi:hypothetical protein
MKKFIFSILFSIAMLSLFGQNKNKANVIFEPTSYSFGEVAMWENQPALFVVKNNMKEPLVFLPLFNEIDLEVRLPDRPIAPGESFVIEAIYYTAGKGSFERKFNVFMGHAANPVQLKISGNIKALSPNAYQQCPTLKPQTAKGKIEVTGKSVNKETGQEISEAIITIQSMTDRNRVNLVTDKLGGFVSKLPNGSYEIWVEKTGFQPFKTTFFVGSNPVYLELPLQLIPQIAVSTPVKIDSKEEKPVTIIDKEIEDDKTTNISTHTIIVKQETITSKPTENILEKKPEPLITKSTFEEKSEPVRTVKTDVEKPLENSTSSALSYNSSLKTEEKLPILRKNNSDENFI